MTIISDPAQMDHAAGPLPPLPDWVRASRSDDIEELASLSGAALAHVHLLLARPDVPQTLLRMRLALRAAEACVTLSGRPERKADLRDAVLFLRPGDLPGPAGTVYQCWQHAVARRVSKAALARALPDLPAEDIGHWLAAGQGGAVARASAVLEAALQDHPRQEHAALILADAVLARTLGWVYPVPLLAIGLTGRDLRREGDALRRACHRAVVIAIEAMVPMAADLSRRAARLVAVTPKLRAKAAPGAVEMFLTQDAVTAGALPLPDRAARRLCDRLVSLGVARELRLYGV